MNRLWFWIRSAFTITSDRARLMALERKCRLYSSQAAFYSDELITVRRDLEQVSSRAESLLDQQSKICLQYDHQIELLRNEIQVYRDVTIPTLVAEHKRITSVLDRETAVNTIHQQMKANASQG